MTAAKDQPDPIKVEVTNKVEVVNTQTAPLERRSVPVSFSVGQVPQLIAPLSNKRIQLILSVTGANAFLCTSQSQAGQVSSTYNAGAALQPGVYTLMGTGEFWIVASQGTVVVGVIAEYEV
jgi:hypothetical protein